MHAKPLPPVVTLDGQPAAGETIIRQLIKELGHCQEQLAACLPEAVGLRPELSELSDVADVADDGDEATPASELASSTVNALVTTEYNKLTFEILQSESRILDLKAEVTELEEEVGIKRLLQKELGDHFGGEVPGEQQL